MTISYHFCGGNIPGVSLEFAIQLKKEKKIILKQWNQRWFHNEFSDNVYTAQYDIGVATSKSLSMPRVDQDSLVLNMHARQLYTLPNNMYIRNKDKKRIAWGLTCDVRKELPNFCTLHGTSMYNMLPPTHKGQFLA